MKAMILAAGVGSRLDPLTRRLPKPMVPLVNKPVIEHIVELLKKHGINEIMMNLYHLGDSIRNHFGDGSKWGVKIYYSQEAELMGTAGGVKRVETFFDDTFIVIGGDDLADFDLTALVEFHKRKNALSTIALSKVDDPSQFGIVLLDEEGRITRFLEKPKESEAFSNTANTGVYLFEPEALSLIPENEFYDFGKQLFPKLLEMGKPFYGYLTDSYWSDVGNIESYRETQNDVLAGKVALNLPVKEQSPQVWMGEDVVIDPSAEIKGPVVIGNGCRIGAGARVLENSILGDHCVVEENAVLHGTTLWEGATVMRDTWLDRCVVGSECHVQTNAAIFDGIIVSPHRDKDSSKS
ncbi:MAG: NDP-sugar synthase [Armatimonadetes bacterium]|nr:NDP-sugar synthase [Armatimonadota bacterium]